MVWYSNDVSILLDEVESAVENLYIRYIMHVIYKNNIIIASIMFPIACHLWNFVPHVLYLTYLRKLIKETNRWNDENNKREIPKMFFWRSNMKNNERIINPEDITNNKPLANI